MIPFALRRIVPAALLTALAVLLAGCGALTDTRDIEIAQVGGRTITRGELRQVIRRMPATERPHLTNRGDVRRALNAYIDRIIKTNVGRQLEEAGAIEMPRQLAEQVVDEQHPELTQDASYDFGVTQGELASRESERDFLIERTRQRLLGEQAIAFIVGQLLRRRELPVTDEQFALEYKYRQETLAVPESVVFRTLIFPKNEVVDARRKAAAARERLKRANQFDDLAGDLAGGDIRVVEIRLSDNEQSPNYLRGFWQQARGMREGTVLGPLFFPAGRYPAPGEEEEEAEPVLLPETWAVGYIAEHFPRRPMTLEEAKEGPHLRQWIYLEMAMDRLREVNNVRVFEDNLWHPGGSRRMY